MNSPNLFSFFLKIISALACTLGIMLITMYLLKRAMKRTIGVNNSLIKILSAQYLGPKSSIMIIDILGDILVIGISNNQISLLTRIVNQNSLEQLKDIQRQETKNLPFFDYLMHCKAKLYLHSHLQKGMK